MSDEQTALVEAQIKANDQTLARLRSQGVQIGQDVMLTLRLEVLTMYLLGSKDGTVPPVVTASHIDYELQVQRRIEVFLDDIESQVRRAKLTAGVTSPNGHNLQIPPR